MTYSNATAPATRRIRAYFAPVARTTESPTIFDPARSAGFTPDAPPTPWLDLGWIRGFVRRPDTKVQAVLTGVPGGVQMQTRTVTGASVSFQFEQWTKLTMALSGGSQHMNVLAGSALVESAANGSGSKAAAAVSVAAAGGSAADFLQLNAADTTGFSVGDMVAVDVDYTGQVGFVGSGVSAAFLKSSASVQNDADYVRRVTFNVARVRAVTSNGLQLASPLLAGAPGAGMRAQRISGFVDREGGTFFQEWSALFVAIGEQGDRVFFHYPRLQWMASAGESASVLAHPISELLLDASFRALPVVDSNDGERVFSFRTYVPGANAAILA